MRSAATGGRPGPRWAVLGLGLLAVDALLLIPHRLHTAVVRLGPEGAWPRPLDAIPWWVGTGDGSPVELWGQLQLVVAAVLLVRLALRAPGRRVLAVWGLALVLMAADDLFRIHERAGTVLGLERAGPGLNDVGAQELGGLLYWAVVGAVLGAALVRTCATSTPAARRAALVLVAAALPLAVVAVAYVALSAFASGVLTGLPGVVVVDVRVTVKLLTTTAFLVLAVHMRERLP